MLRNNIYDIVCTTDFYHAARNPRFAHHENSYVIASNLTLKEAQARLLKMFSYDAECPIDNWGLAVNNHYKDELEAYKTLEDGTRAYRYDVYIYEIQKILEL